MTEINGDGDLEMTNGNIFLTSVFFQVVLEAGDILVVNTNWWFHETKVFFFRYAKVLHTIQCLDLTLKGYIFNKYKFAAPGASQNFVRTNPGI